jgi:hypothetical protein
MYDVFAKYTITEFLRHCKYIYNFLQLHLMKKEFPAILCQDSNDL